MTFDGVTIAYYAVICGALAALVPQVSGAIRRIVLGAAIGVVAATLAPNLRAAFGL